MNEFIEANSDAPLESPESSQVSAPATGKTAS